MNWSKTKLIFIICFFLLDAFLVFELYQRQQAESIGGLTDGQASNVLQNGSVKLQTVLPPTPQDATFLRGSRVDFSNEKANVSALMDPGRGMVRQKISIENGGLLLHSVFSGPTTVSMENANFQKNLLNMVYQGQDFALWQSGSKKGDANFVQLFNNRPVFISSRSNIPMLDFTVSNNQITGYRQSYFNFKQTSRVGVITAETAINNLAAANDLPGSEHPQIKVVELGYVNLIGDTGSDPLIFVPAWHIVVKKDKSTSEFFVNAVSGTVQSLN